MQTTRSNRITKTAGVAGVAVCLGLSIAGAASQQATFKGAVRTVAVYATVTEAGGHLVTNLTKDDFTIEDNGKRQDLTVFANDIQPITVVVMLDRSASMRGQFELVEKAAERFVTELQPGDKARIGSFSNRIQLDPRGFSSDKAELLEILRSELQEEGPTPLWNAVNVGITALLHQEGRRVILVFTDGVDEPFNPGPSSSTLKDVMRRAEEEDVMVYAIGLAGSNGAMRGFGGRGRGGPGGRGRGGRGGPGGIGIPGGPGGTGGPNDARQGGPGGFGGGRVGGGGGGWGGRGYQRSPGTVDPGLPKLAEATGGGYFELTSTDDLGSTFKRVADELHHQYLLGFAPVLLDGKMHRLDVNTPNAAFTIRARKTYLAARDR
jgi:VWFA-related protein